MTADQEIATAPAPQDSRIRRRYKWRVRRADTLGVIVYLSVAISLALFVADGGIQKYFTSWEQVPLGAGIVAGLVGTDLVLVMLLLSARLPVIDRTFGHDVALATHRKLGKPVLYLILAHMVLLLIGYSILDGVSIVAQAVSLWNTVPDMWMAFVATAALIAVVVTSLVIVRRKLAYQFWLAVHFLAYAAVLASLPHQFSTGMMFAEGTWARWYWAALIVSTLAAITIFRFIIPIAKSLRHRLRVIDVVVEAPGVMSVVMGGRDLHRLRARGGQFFNWRFWTPGLVFDPHPFSLSAAPDGRTLRITVRDLGAGSARLLNLRPGTSVSFEGPYGLFTETARTTDKVVLIGAGIGITPIRALLEDPHLRNTDISVVLRGGSHDDVYLWQETYDLCVAKDAWLRVLVGHRPTGVSTWLSADAFNRGERLATLVPFIADADVFICGPDAWTDLVVRDATHAGVPAHRIHVERFDF
jgi:predicted ferric reductase